MNSDDKILEMLGQIVGRLDKLETEVSGLRGTVEELDERSLRSAVLLESDIAPKVRLLFEGQKNLLDTLTPKERTEQVEEKVVVLESVVKSHSERIAALEKAQ